MNMRKMVTVLNNYLLKSEKWYAIKEMIIIHGNLSIVLAFFYFNFPLSFFNLRPQNNFLMRMILFT
jgi:hypothetical protein